jgi:hypothetical protein
MNVVSVVVLTSPRDSIRSKHHNGRCLWALHTYNATTTTPPRSARCGGVVDGISSMTTWCVWWRVSTGRASPTHTRWTKIGKDLVKLGLEKTTYETTGDSEGWSKITPSRLSTWSFCRCPHAINLRSKQALLGQTANKFGLRRTQATSFGGLEASGLS